MKNGVLSRWSMTLICWMLVAVFLSCTPTIKPQKMTDEEALRTRVQEFWGHRIKGEWDKCYLYELPDYREKVNLQRYINQNRRFILRWVGFSVMEIWTSGEEGYVKLSTEFRYLVPEAAKKGVSQRTAEEKWIKKDGYWYHLSIL
jgi:hypothetical protein